MFSLCLLQIVIHGSMEATVHLVDYARKNLGIDAKKVSAPSVGDCIDATTESYIYQVRKLRQPCHGFLELRWNLNKNVNPQQSLTVTSVWRLLKSPFCLE